MKKTVPWVVGNRIYREPFGLRLRCETGISVDYLRPEKAFETLPSTKYPGILMDFTFPIGNYTDKVIEKLEEDEGDRGIFNSWKYSSLRLSEILRSEQSVNRETPIFIFFDSNGPPIEEIKNAYGKLGNIELFDESEVGRNLDLYCKKIEQALL